MLYILKTNHRSKLDPLLCATQLPHLTAYSACAWWTIAGGVLSSDSSPAASADLRHPQRLSPTTTGSGNRLVPVPISHIRKSLEILIFLEFRKQNVAECSKGKITDLRFQCVIL